MKKIITILFTTAVLSVTSCSLFLEKPDTTGTVDQEAVFSTTKNARAALMSCYRNVLRHGWPGGMGIGHCTYGAISGEVGRGYNWHGSYHISQQGLTVNGTDGSDAGAENYGNNWRFIRECYIVIENVDNVADMSDADKAVIKAEATALIAYRYMGMFYRYGGVPIVEKSFESSDDLSAPRASLAEMVEFISLRRGRRGPSRQVGRGQHRPHDQGRRPGHQGPDAAFRRPSAVQQHDPVPGQRRAQ